jgi:hypothetical protein
MSLFYACYGELILEMGIESMQRVAEVLESRSIAKENYATRVGISNFISGLRNEVSRVKMMQAKTRNSDLI